MLTRRAMSRVDHGFTMIELVVSMTLMLVVLGIVSTLLFNSVDEVDRGSSNRMAASRARLAIETIGTDIRAAYAPDRALLGDVERLRSAMLAPATSTLDVRDVTWATPTILELRSDVVATGEVQTPECVRYEQLSDGSLRRTVRSGDGGAWRTCSGAILSRTVLLDAPPSAFRQSSIFSYTVDRNTVNVNNPSRCVRERMQQVTGLRALAGIAMIRVDVRSFVVRKSAAGLNSFVSELAVRSRTGGSYRAAIGCEAA